MNKYHELARNARAIEDHIISALPSIYIDDLERWADDDETKALVASVRALREQAYEVCRHLDARRLALD